MRRLVLICIVLFITAAEAKADVFTDPTEFSDLPFQLGGFTRRGE